MLGETCGVTEGEVGAPGYAKDWPDVFGANWLVCVLVLCGGGEACPGPISPGNGWMPKSDACGSVDAAPFGGCPGAGFGGAIEPEPGVPIFEGEITASAGGWLNAGFDAGLFSTGKGTGVPNVGPFFCCE